MQAFKVIVELQTKGESRIPVSLLSVIVIFININCPRIIAEVWDQVALLLPWGIRVCCEGGKGEWLGGSDGCRSLEATGLMSDVLLVEGRAGGWSQ